MAENSPPALGLTLLAAALAKPVVTGMWYNNKIVKLDGYKFIGCRFDKCKLHVTTTNFILERCFIDDETTIVYGKEVLKIIQLYNNNYTWVYEHNPNFAPTKNSDNTISVGA